MYGIQLATATLTGYNQIAFDALASFEESILALVKIAAVKNLDETGFRVAGKTQLRELKAIIEHDKESWVSEMRRLLRVMLRCRHFHGDNAIPPERIKWLIKIYDRIIKQGVNVSYNANTTPL